LVGSSREKIAVLIKVTVVYVYVQVTKRLPLSETSLCV